MLNRTNRTLSANPNRLDLGTRMLGLAAGANNGNLTLRTALHRPTVVRVGLVEDLGIRTKASPIEAMPKPSKPAMSAMPGSSSRPASPDRGSQAGGQGQFAGRSPDPVVDAPPGVVAGVGGVRPRVARSHRHPRPRLDWRCDRASRSALAPRTGVAPTS